MTKPRLVACLLTPALALALLLPSAAPAAQDFFLKIDGIPGESVDEKHEGEIDVLSFSWGVTVAKQANGEAFAVTKRVDRASPQLFLHAARGQVIPRVLFTVRQPGEQPLDYLTYCLTEVRVTSVSTTGSAGEDSPTEKLSLSYRTFSQGYRSQNADGSLNGPFTAGWDFFQHLPVATSTC